MVDGEAVRSCVLPVDALKDGAVTTLEGLGTSAKPSRLQQAFIDEQAAQCGYCINGMIMTSAALLAKNKSPSEAQIREALADNLCRCGTHKRIVAAVKRARQRPEGEATMTTSSARTSFDRREFLKASGILAVGFSMSGVPGPAVGATLRAPKSVAKEAVDSWLTISPDNRVTIFCGKVDLGTGARTALAQMAAEELDVAFDRIEMVMGDTATTPDQWLTAGNLTIFQGGSELRRAAASARRALVDARRSGSAWPPAS